MSGALSMKAGVVIALSMYFAHKACYLKHHLRISLGMNIHVAMAMIDRLMSGPSVRRLQREFLGQSVVWFPKGVSYGCRMKWKQFNELMQREAKQFKSDDRRVPNHRPNFPLPTPGERG